MERRDARLAAAAVFCLGALLGLLPSLYLFLVAPRQFTFGNFHYPALNTAYRLEAGFSGPANPMDISEKLDYLWNNVLSQPGNLLLLLAFLAPVPFAVLAIAFGLSRLVYHMEGKPVWAMLLFVQVVLLANFFHPEDYRRVSFLRYVDLWRPIMAHNLGVEIGAAAGQGRVLTFAPVYPLEGSAGIYPEFATGAFAWRTAPFLKAEQRSQLGIISCEELDGLLTRDPPAAILTGLEPLLEEPFVEYARRNAYQWLAITEEIGLWIASSGEVP